VTLLFELITWTTQIPAFALDSATLSSTSTPIEKASSDPFPSLSTVSTPPNYPLRSPRLRHMSTLELLPPGLSWHATQSLRSPWSSKGPWKYEECSLEELRKFVASRRLPFKYTPAQSHTRKSPSKREREERYKLVDALKKADADAGFPFLGLVGELRERIYDVFLVHATEGDYMTRNQVLEKLEEISWRFLREGGAVYERGNYRTKPEPEPEPDHSERLVFSHHDVQMFLRESEAQAQRYIKQLKGSGHFSKKIFEAFRDAIERVYGVRHFYWAGRRRKLCNCETLRACLHSPYRRSYRRQ
jgi:hypothetical protein